MMIDTSLDAWSIVKITLGARQQIVYECIKKYSFPRTAPEIAGQLQLSLRSVAPRITELSKLGLIIRDTRVTCTVTGGSAWTWRVK